MPILGILKSATLSDSFVSVLSEKALTDGMSALSEQFGRLPLLSSMLLDDRETVRALANNELSKPNRLEESAIPKENFKQRFKPFLHILSQNFERNKNQSFNYLNVFYPSQIIELDIYKLTVFFPLPKNPIKVCIVLYI